MSDTDRAILNELVPADRQTGVLRHDLVAAVAEVIRIRRVNTVRGAAMLNALHRDCGSWPTVAYLCGLTRMTAKRWGDKVIPDDAG